MLEHQRGGNRRLAEASSQARHSTGRAHFRHRLTAVVWVSPQSGSAPHPRSMARRSVISYKLIGLRSVPKELSILPLSLTELREVFQDLRPRRPLWLATFRRRSKLNHHWCRMVRLLDLPPLLAIRAALTMHLSLGRRPHRCHRSHSPQTKPDPCRVVAIRVASLETFVRMAPSARIGPSFCNPCIEIRYSACWQRH
jgi:hypothetical protein